MHVSDQYSYITHYVLLISIFVNYLSGCILRHATNSYMPIFNQFLHAYKAGNYHLITPRDWKSCDRQKWRRVWLPRVLNSLCPTLPQLMLIDAIFLYLTEARYPSGSSDILKRAIRRKAAVCVARDGVLYVQKKKKDNSVSVQGLIIRSPTRIGINIIILWTFDI